MTYKFFSLLPLGRRAGDEGWRKHGSCFLFVLRERRVAFKDKHINRVDAQ
jgi:hypothetical protein